jgi:hypothetical protein
MCVPQEYYGPFFKREATIVVSKGGRFMIREVLKGKYVELTALTGEWYSRIWFKSVKDGVLFLKKRGKQYEYQPMLPSEVLLDDKVDSFLINPRTIEYSEKLGAVSACRLCSLPHHRN